MVGEVLQDKMLLMLLLDVDPLLQLQLLVVLLPLARMGDGIIQTLLRSRGYLYSYSWVGRKREKINNLVKGGYKAPLLYTRRFDIADDAFDARRVFQIEN